MTIDLMIQQARESFAQGQLAPAEAVLNEVLASRADHGDALLLMGRIAFRRTQYELAVNWFKKAVASDRKRAQFHCSLASAELTVGRLAKAIVSFERAIALQPDYVDAIAGKADALERKGKSGRAVALLEPLVRSGKATRNAPAVYVRALLAEGKTDKAIDAGRALVRQREMRPLDRRSVMLLIGRGLDTKGLYDDAFEAYREANELQRQPFDIDETRRHIDTIIAIFTRDALSARGEGRSESELPVFVFGMPRTGSTLIEQIIHAHPRAYGAGEIHDLMHLARVMPRLLGLDQTYPACVAGLTDAQLTQLAANFLTQLQQYAPGAERLVDKSLENTDLLGLIQMLMPRGRLIHARRHPLDVCLSCYFQDLHPGLHPYSTDLRDLGLYYREQMRLMDHWQSALDMPILDVAYEDLVADAESMSRRIIEFIGLPFDDACLRFHEARREVSTISYAQVRKPVYGTAVARYARYEQHLGPLREALGDLVPA